MGQDRNDSQSVGLGDHPSTNQETCCQVTDSDNASLQHETAVADRYSQAAHAKEDALCCPVSYRPELLQVIPDEIIQRDYGCGDPSQYLRSGETVLDLGSGGGKLCYIAAQVVGPEGKVIGVDCNSEMLALARQHQAAIAEKIGHDVVSFRFGVIQNLALDLEQYEQACQGLTSDGIENVLDRRRLEQKLSQESPMVADGSVDCVVSNCVLNLVRPEDRIQLFEEIYRVLKVGGRAAISDIVSDEDVPQHMKDSPELWSGCISGAWREDQFVRQFEKAGFHGIRIDKRESKPWRTVEGIEFRSVTVVAYKPDPSTCLERRQALVYKGPFKQVVLDDEQMFVRGERIAVCDKTYQAAGRDPFREHFIQIAPVVDIPVESAEQFDCKTTSIRSPQETKEGNKPAETEVSGDKSCCSDQDQCC